MEQTEVYDYFLKKAQEVDELERQRGRKLLGCSKIIKYKEGAAYLNVEVGYLFYSFSLKLDLETLLTEDIDKNKCSTVTENTLDEDIYTIREHGDSILYPQEFLNIPRDEITKRLSGEYRLSLCLEDCCEDWEDEKSVLLRDGRVVEINEDLAYDDDKEGEVINVGDNYQKVLDYLFLGLVKAADVIEPIARQLALEAAKCDASRMFQRRIRPHKN